MAADVGDGDVPVRRGRPQKQAVLRLVSDPSAHVIRAEMPIEAAAVASTVAPAMARYHTERLKIGHDDFKVDFKREGTAASLATMLALSATRGE